MGLWNKRIGLMKSKVMYNWKPFNAKRLRQFYGQFVKPGGLCFDVGAHVGNRSKAWQQLGAKVVAYEPQPYFFDFLKKNMPPDIEILPLALDKQLGEATFMISSLHPPISTISTEWQSTVKAVKPNIVFDEKITVETTTLDLQIAKFGMPDFVKIDVEGKEFDVLLGLSQALPMLSFEFYGPQAAAAFQSIDLLVGLGNYSFNYSLTESLKFAQREWLNADDFKAELVELKTKKSGDIYARLNK